MTDQEQKAGRGADGTRVPRKPLSSGAEFAGLGVQMALTLVLSALAGRWLDAKLGTSPWLLLLLVFVGAAAAFYSIYRRVIGTGSKSEKDGRR
jgi:ATP synthase protein I